MRVITISNFLIEYLLILDFKRDVASRQQNWVRRKSAKEHLRQLKQLLLVKSITSRTQYKNLLVYNYRTLIYLDLMGKYG